MNLIIDIGNSRCKMALCTKQGALVKFHVKENFDEAVLCEWQKTHEVSKAILSSSRGEQEELHEKLKKLVGHCIKLCSDTPIPVKNNYATPKTLGMDRLAAAVGADLIVGNGGGDCQKNGDENRNKDEAASNAANKLIIDMGTAITIDFVSKDGVFEGGYISLGVGARFRALNEFTASLPLFEPENLNFETPRTTKDAIIQGVMQGIFHEINGHIKFFLDKYGEISVIFAGGDAKYFANKIKNAIFAKEDLVILGLNRILEYNAAK